MTDNKFKDINLKVKGFFEASLMQGEKIIDIMQRLRDEPLPLELQEYNSNDIKRHAQIVGTNYLRHEADKAVVNENDIINYV